MCHFIRDGANEHCHGAASERLKASSGVRSKDGVRTLHLPAQEEGSQQAGERDGIPRASAHADMRQGGVDVAHELAGLKLSSSEVGLGVKWDHGKRDSLLMYWRALKNSDAEHSDERMVSGRSKMTVQVWMWMGLTRSSTKA